MLGIEPGADFVEKLESAVRQCEVLNALIGTRWAGEDARSKARIADSQDWVHVELATALRRGIKVIPVLLDGARMPAVENLPSDLQSLVRMNATDVRASRLNADVWDLTGATMSALGERWPPRRAGRKDLCGTRRDLCLFCGRSFIVCRYPEHLHKHRPTHSIGYICVSDKCFGAVKITHSLVGTHADASTGAADRSRGHFVGFTIMSAGASDVDGVMIFVFGVTPAALMFLASFAMRRLVRS